MIRSLFFLCAAISWIAAPNALAFSLAEGTYTLIHGKCPPLKSPSGSPPSSCSRDQALNQLQKDSSRISENSYLGALALERWQALTCSRQKLQSLRPQASEQAAFIDDFTFKMRALIKEKRTMARLLPALGTSKPSSVAGSPASEYKMARARSEAILNSFAFTESPAMRKMIALISSQEELGTGEIPDSQIENYIRDMVLKTIPIVDAEMEKSLSALRKGADTMGAEMDSNLRESLAQDTDLVESYRQKNLKSEDLVIPVACRVDAKYGKGAQYRDQSLFAASVLGTLAGAGLPAIAARGAAGFSAQVTGAAARGMISSRSAGILRASSMALDSSILARQIEKACFSEVSTLGGRMKDPGSRCESSVLTELSDSNCTLTVAMSMMGAPGFFKSAKESAALMAVKPTSAAKKKWVETPAGPMAADKNHFQNYRDLLLSGKLQEAEALDRKVQETLKTGRMTALKDVGGSSRGGGKFVRFDDGTLGIWKPYEMQKGSFQGKVSGPYEVAAFKLDRYLGYNRVPATVEKEFEGKKGTVQLLAGDLKKQPLKDDPEELILFDYLIANRDRHDENYLITRSGNIVAIDHGLSLQKKTAGGGFQEVVESILQKDATRADLKVAQYIRAEKRKNPQASFSKEALEKIRQKEAALARAETIQEITAIAGEKGPYLKLKNATDQDFKVLMKDQLNDSELQELLKRRQEIVDSIEKARKQLGDEVFRSGPSSPVREIHNDLSD